MQLADPFYYLDNFKEMIETLQRRDGDLLAPDEVNFMVGFADLPKPSRALLVRMIMRRGPLFRGSRLTYPEIGGLDAAILPLIAFNWVDACPALTLADVLDLFSKAEVVRHLSLPKIFLREPKAALLAGLCGTSGAPKPVHAWCGTAERVFRLLVGDLCRRLRLMFFGNFRQDWTEFVLADLGVFKYEKLPLHRDSRPFRTRRQVDDFHRLYRCREMLQEGGELPEIERMMPSHVADCEWLEERREKLRFQIARAHERAGEIERASEIYSTCAYPEARIRERRISRAAARQAAIGQPATGRPATGRPATGRPAVDPGRRRSRHRPAVPTFELVLDEAGEGGSVECRVRDHLLGEARDETCVHYVENSLINSLFGLLCWPAIFAPVPGAFFHAFHHGPADLSTPGFCDRRKREFASCLAELKGGRHQEIILRRCAEKQGISSPFVAWGLMHEGLLRTALACFPAAHLGLWFEWMMRDLKVNRSGFPDLVQFWPRERRYRLIEVKGPGDRLQDNQHRCIEFLLAHDMPVSVCRVRGASMNSLL